MAYFFLFSEGTQSTKLGESSFDSSPGSSSSTRTPTPKRAQPPGSTFTGHSSGQVHSPPIVTIAPTPSYSSVAASDGRKVSKTCLTNHWLMVFTKDKLSNLLKK